MTAAALSAYKFAASYARYLPQERRRETPYESFARVIDMHRTKYAGIDIEDELAFCQAAMNDNLILGSQRALQFGGKPILRQHARLYNCTTSYCDRPRFFQECLFLLLCGCGAGFSVQKHHVARLPKMITPDPNQIRRFTIPDTVEGWADALGVLLASYGIVDGSMAEFSAETAPGDESDVTFVPEGYFKDYVGSFVSFDYSRIRDKGADLSTGAGKAPGPGPLMASLEKIRKVLDDRLKMAQAGEKTFLRPIDAYDIIMHASDAVLAGGVRRSATICLFSPDDAEMMAAKTGSWMVDNPQRARSNNSAMLLRGETSWEDFRDIFMTAREQYGEPGFVWADNTEITYNPCVEIGLYPAIDTNSVEEVLGVPTGKIQELADGRTLVDIRLEDGTTHAAISDAQGRFSGWAFCVSGNTSIMTPDGVCCIQDRVGAETQIWNGSKWCKTTPFQTSDSAKLYRVELSDGSYLDCDANHRWLVKDRFGEDYEEVATTDLLTFSKYPIHTPRSEFSDRSGIFEPQAYELGFILGDGSVDPSHGSGRVRATLYGDKIDLPLEGRRSPRGRRAGYGVDSVDITFDVDVKFAEQLKKHPSALRDLHSWDAASILDFFAGWADADGSQAGRGIRIYSTEERCRLAQLLLSRVGILGSVNLHHEGSTNFGERTEASWYIQITECQEIGCHRLDTSRGHKPLAKGRHQIIRSVTELDGTHATYCLEEPETGCCVFNNVLTKQCNLCEINAKACTTEAEFERAARAAAILGTLQAGYTDFGYLGPVSAAIARREALLGCSMTGMMDNPRLAFDPDFQRHLARLIVDTNASFCEKIGVLPTARATCVKPAGSTSCILGTSSGIHAQHAKRYFRRAQANETEAPAKFFRLRNPKAVEKSVWNPNGTDAVITFCIEAGDEALTRREVSGLKQLEYVKLTQENWVEAGKVEKRCAQPWLRHNVSNTITIDPSEQEQACRYIYDHREAFAGISIIDSSGDLDYPQAPFCEVRTEEELLERYGRGVFFASGLIVDGLHAFGENLWLACDTVMGIGEAKVLANGVPYPDDPTKLPDAIRDAYREVHQQKKDWIRRARQFATNYFGFGINAETMVMEALEKTPEGTFDHNSLLRQLEKLRQPLKRMTYCLKEVNNLKLWADLTREWADVDYSEMLEQHDGTKSVVLDTACAGAACSLEFV